MKFLESIFYSTMGSIISSIIIFAFLPTSNLISNQNPTNMFLNPQFIASVIIGIFLVILFQFCRKLFIEIKKTKTETENFRNEIVTYKTYSHFIHLYRMKKLYQGNWQYGNTSIEIQEYIKHMKQEFEAITKWINKDNQHIPIIEIKKQLLPFYQLTENDVKDIV